MDIEPIVGRYLNLDLEGAKYRIYFGEPIYFEGTGDEEDAEILAKVKVVKEQVAALIKRGLSERKGVFF